MKEFDHIPTDEILKDIEDTKREIADYDDEERILMRNPQENKVRLYFIHGHVQRRYEFIKKLLSIIEYRKENIVDTLYSQHQNNGDTE